MLVTYLGNIIVCKTCAPIARSMARPFLKPET